MAKHNWVFIDETNGAACANGEKLSFQKLEQIALACVSQVNNEFGQEWGGSINIRIGAADHIAPGEIVYAFKPVLPEAPGASAYHDVDGNGVPFAFCAVTTCDSLLGPGGVSIDASHEILETQADPGANRSADDDQGMLHAIEVCDPNEVQGYIKKLKDGTQVFVSDWMLQNWFTPNAKGLLNYMAAAKIVGAVAPPGPFQLAPSPDGQGNYQIVGPSSRDQMTQVFGRRAGRILGHPRKPAKVSHWSSRASRRLGHGSFVMPPLDEIISPDEVETQPDLSAPKK